MNTSWIQRVVPAHAFHATSLLTDAQQQQLIEAIRRWGDEAKAWRDAQATVGGKLPHELKHETNHFDSTSRTSSVTMMDKKLGADISAFLSQLTPGIPVINEEASAEQNARVLQEAKKSAEAAGEAGPTYWVVDPIDGTDNFIDPAKHEYGVLIGLIEQGQPRFGITYYPDYDQLNVTRGSQAISIHHGHERLLQVSPFTRLDRKGHTAKLELTSNVVKCMRKQTLPEDAALSARLEEQSIRTNCMVGAIDPDTRQSLDYGDYPGDQLVLAGKAHLSSFTKGGFEWDYAARHAIIRAAGGEVILKETGQPPHYGEEGPGYLRPVWIGHPQTLEQIGVVAPVAERAATAVAATR